jgi:hypothetical protein
MAALPGWSLLLKIWKIVECDEAEQVVVKSSRHPTALQTNPSSLVVLAWAHIDTIAIRIREREYLEIGIRFCYLLQPFVAR